MTTLMPRKDGRYLKPAEVIARMQAAFAYLETSEEGARERVATWMEQLVFVTDEGRTAADQCLNQLEQFQDAARFIHFGNDLGADGMCLSMLMIPHQPLIIDEHAEDEESWFLIYRAAAALDYQVFEPEVEGAKAPEDAGGREAYAAAA